MSARQVDKSYGSTHALRGVDFDLRPGSIHALIGPNGSGKSTLVKCLAGAVQPDKGHFSLDGMAWPGFQSPAHAQQAGISVVHQDPEGFVDLNVAENILIADPPAKGRGPWARRDRSEEIRRATRLLQRVGLSVSPTEPLRNLPLADRTLVSICRAISERARFLVLDEPTSALGRDDAQRVYDVCQTLARQGAAVLIVTHRLHEVLTFATRVTALRDGAVVADRPTAGAELDELVSLVAGQRSAEGPTASEHEGPARIVMSARDVAGDGYTHPVSMEVGVGELATIAGLPGSGANEFLRQVCGVSPRGGGEVAVSRSKEQVAIGFLAEDRRSEGIFPSLSILDNMVVAAIKGPGLLPVRRKEIDRRARLLAGQLGMVAPDLSAPITTLSGGNQQKTLIGRWMLADAAVLGFEEPTNGLDVGAREDVYAAIAGLLSEGKAVLARCSDEYEAARIGSRILVFREGRLESVLTAHADPAAVLDAATPRTHETRAEPEGDDS